MSVVILIIKGHFLSMSFCRHSDESHGSQAASGVSRDSVDDADVVILWVIWKL
jgi:hypothetical protein